MPKLKPSLKTMALFAVLLVLSILQSKVDSANILILSPTPAYSHNLLAVRVAEGLLEKGHHVTMVSSFKDRTVHANFTEIHLEKVYNFLEENKNFLDWEDKWSINQIIETNQLGCILSEMTLKSTKLLDLIKTKKGFYDVLILEQFVDESLTVVAHQLQVPLIYLVTLRTSIWNNHLVGNPESVSHVPNFCMSNQGRMNFQNRLHNLFLYVTEEIYRRTIVFPHHDKLVHEVFPEAPSIYELMYNQDALILVNSHISTNDPIPHLPNIIEIGGFHIKKTQLPEDLKEALDMAKEGAIYFSLGSSINVTQLPEEKIQAILKTFGKFNQTFLLKWEGEFIKGAPDNVILREWFPQQAILEHPNLKAFISHGGLLSEIESITFGKPIIGIPIFVDQKMNINLAVSRGYALLVPYKELTENTLTKALEEILNDPKYTARAQESSKLMNDRKIPPLEEAVFWVEHVIKQKGARHFRSKALDLSWYEYQMIDVVLFIVLSVSALTFGFICIIKVITKKLIVKKPLSKEKLT